MLIIVLIKVGTKKFLKQKIYSTFYIKHPNLYYYIISTKLITIIIIPFYTILGIFLFILSIYIFYFFRDPIRSIPNDDVVVSPADGLVTFIGESNSPLENSLDKKLQLKHLPITKKIDGFYI